jgi:hypothetical protein
MSLALVNKIEELLPWLHYIEGKKNILADNLSQLLRLPLHLRSRRGRNSSNLPLFLKTKTTKTGFLHHVKTPAVSTKTSTTFLNVT